MPWQLEQREGWSGRTEATDISVPWCDVEPQEGKREQWSEDSKTGDDWKSLKNKAETQRELSYQDKLFMVCNGSAKAR